MSDLAMFDNGKFDDLYNLNCKWKDSFYYITRYTIVFATAV